MLTSISKKKALIAKELFNQNAIMFDGIYICKKSPKYANYDHIYRDFEWNSQPVLVLDC